MKKNLNIFLLLFTAMLSYAQTSSFSSDENYVYTKNCLNDDCSKKTEAIQYSDGFGRPKQIISIKATPLGRDVVIPVKYDSFGRNLQTYLPIPQSQTLNGTIYTDPYSNASQSYGTDIYYYSSSTVESSPIGKPLSSTKPGADYQQHSTTFAYGMNVGSEVKLYTVQTTWLNGATKDVISTSSHYAAGQLLKNSVTDEDGNVTTEFVNGKGQTVMVRKAGSTNSDTYYVYNKYNQLSAVIPPLAVTLVPDETNLGKLGYQYRYDAKGRQVEKKLPGKEWEYFVYDKLDRVVMTQDANMGGSKKWLFTKFDKLGRTVFTGIYISTNNYESAGRQAEQNQLNAATTFFESRSTGGFAATGEMAYYTNSVYPTAFSAILSINYYDTYPQGSVARPASIFGKTIISDDVNQLINTKTLPTASYVKNLENDSWTKSYSWYDEKSRIVGTHSVNHLGGYTKTESELDFAGVPQTTKAYHKRIASDPEKVITHRYEYDDKNRLKKQFHKVEGYAEELIADHTYNELGQTSNKSVGNGLQNISYTYNIRGSLTKVNNPVNLGTNLFGYELKSINPTTGVSKYNGAITEVDWKTASDNGLRRYDYTYDSFDRLTAGIYSEPDVSTPMNGFYSETAAYDLGGNITELKRFSKPNTGGTAEKIDDLIYEYNGNRLTKIKLPANVLNNPSGYNALEGTFGYDDNGNMTRQDDKGISNIAYNVFDLPTAITQNGTTLQYLYSADGTKLRKVISGKTTDYLDGFQYENNGLKFVPTAEGYYNFENNKYIYTYADHLGNVRLSYYRNANNSAEVLEENNFYPFGLKHSGYNQFAGNPAFKHQYNGKELQETGMLDYGWRQYMPELGRWNGMDKLAEFYDTVSPYAYVMNNPVMFTDPDGRLVTPIEGGYSFTGSDINLVMSYINSGGSFNNLTNGLDDWSSSGGSGMTNGISTFWNTFNAGNTFGGVKVSNGTLSWWTNGAAGYGNSNSQAGYTIQELINHVTPINQGGLDSFLAAQNNTNSFLDGLQTGLDFVGLVPGLGEIADGANALIYLGRGDYINAGLSAAAMVPFAGMAATGGKIARKLIQKHHIIPQAVYKKAGESVKNAMKLHGGNNLKKLPVPFHGSHFQYNKYVTQRLNELQDVNSASIQALQKDLNSMINNAYDNYKVTGENLNDYFRRINEN